MNQIEPLYTIKTLAKAVGLSPATIRRLYREGTIKPLAFSKRPLYFHLATIIKTLNKKG
jgi:DNA-binding transcriptional MerR regulator